MGVPGTRSGMDLTDDSILDAAMRVVARYGIRRATVADMAREAGVSRQTLYDRYDDKDGIMAASIRRMAHRMCHETREAMVGARGLADKIDAYFRIAVLPVHELMQSLPDAADLQHGKGPASKAASQEAEAAKQAMLAAMLRDELPSGGPRPEDVAAFVEQSSGWAKMSGMSREELDRFLEVLKASVLALAGKQ